MTDPTFTRRQLRAIDRLGDTMLPGDEVLPRFSTLDLTRNAAAVFRTLPEQDCKDLQMLLGVLGWLPRFLVAFVLWVLDHADHIPGPAGNLLRMARIGLKGMVMTLYWNDERVLGLVGYDVGVYTADLTPTPAGSAT